MEVTRQNCIELITKNFPNFLPYLETAITYWGEEWAEAGLFNHLMPFEDYTIDIIKRNDEIEVKKIFDFVEFLLCNGDDDLQTAITTGFWEAILHNDPDNIRIKNFVKYMGAESLAYCKAWDEFCGMKTEGLWDDDKELS